MDGMPELKPCPFCGGNAHVRSKIFSRRNEPHRKVTVYDFDLRFGTVENEVDVLDWRFGFQVWCGRCKVKTPYKRGPWHAYTKTEVEELGREDFHRHAPTEADEPAILAAVDSWNRRTGDGITDQ